MSKKDKTHTIARTTERELLFSVTTSNGLVVETFRSGGHGGQNVNKVETGARVKHPASGAVGQSTDERSQYQNKRIALKRMVATSKFQYWVQLQVREIENELSVEDWLEAEMAQTDHFRVEYKDDAGRWVEVE